MNRALLELRQIRMLLKLSESESIIDAIERMINAHAVKIYDDAKEFNAREEAKAARYTLGAILMSQPDMRITITRAARANVGPFDEISSFEDAATGAITFFLIRK